ncbi:MAG: hypothetical protein VW600_09325 [Ferrovibrio sp.]
MKARRLKAALAAGLALLMAGSAVAQQGLGPGSRPKRPEKCFNTPELEAEAIVRAGMIIRDHARACARRGHDGGIIELWARFDGENAEEFRKAVEVRAEAFRRNWPDDPYAAQRAANDTVASRQLVDFAPAECVALRNLVEGFTIWTDYMKHVRVVELGQVKTIYRQCPKRSPGEAPRSLQP